MNKEHLKRILKYALVFIVGLLVGFCTTYEMAKDLVEKRQNRLWVTTAPAHKDVLNDSVAEAITPRSATHQ